MAHVLRLIYEFPIVEAPFIIHWVVVLFGGYATAGFVWYIRQIDFQGFMDKLLYGLVIFHLGGSVVLHAYSLITRSNDWMGFFSMGYSYFAILYFVGLGGYCWSLGKRIEKL